MATQFKKVGLALGATETDETDIGDIVVPSGASRITGVYFAVALETGTATEGTLGVGTLSFTGSQELDGIPASIACMEELGGSHIAQFIKCNIPVKELTTISCGAYLTKAQTGAAYGLCCLRFE